jgi:hypothetical protein
MLRIEIHGHPFMHVVVSQSFTPVNKRGQN